jgi:GT2 family glycosyltransferase
LADEAPGGPDFALGPLPFHLRSRMRILAVIVRYKMRLEGSPTMVSLSEAFRLHPELRREFGVLVWDNSPTPLENLRLPFPFKYDHSRENIGVSGAYNRALKVAEQGGFAWMLLLDQDTTLPDDFLPRLLGHIERHEGDSQVAAMVPFLVDGAIPSSPVAVLCGRNKPISPPFEGFYPGEIFAANSGVTIRAAALREAGGYDEDFWLDLSDVVLFHKLHLKGKRVWIAGDLQVQHRITNNDFDGSMSPQRYSNFVAAEGAYWDLYRGWLPRSIYMARLLGRVFRQYRRFRNKSFSRISRSYLIHRLISSRQERLRQWKEQSLRRNLPAVEEGKVIG